MAISTDPGPGSLGSILSLDLSSCLDLGKLFYPSLPHPFLSQWIDASIPVNASKILSIVYMFAIMTVMTIEWF